MLRLRSNRLFVVLSALIATSAACASQTALPPHPVAPPAPAELAQAAPVLEPIESSPVEPAPIAPAPPATASNTPRGAECTLDTRDCNRVCENYDRMIDEMARDPRFMGDRICRGQCLRLCRAPESPYMEASWACQLRHTSFGPYKQCVDRCQPRR